MSGKNVDWWMGHLGGPARIHLVQTLPANDISEACRLHDYAFAEIDAREKKQDLLDALAGELRFPPYFGGNWDALADVLRDMSWNPAAGFALAIRQGERLAAMRRRELTSFVRVLATAAEEGVAPAGRNTAPRSFHTLLETASVSLFRDLIDAAVSCGITAAVLCEHTGPTNYR